MKVLKIIIGILIIIVGGVLIYTGYNVKIPSDFLTDSLDLEERLGLTFIFPYTSNDGYNFLIGSNIVSNNILAKTISKTLYICFGSLISIIGLIVTFFSIKKNK